MRCLERRHRHLRPQRRPGRARGRDPAPGGLHPAARGNSGQKGPKCRHRGAPASSGGALKRCRGLRSWTDAHALSGLSAGLGDAQGTAAASGPGGCAAPAGREPPRRQRQGVGGTPGCPLSPGLHRRVPGHGSGAAEHLRGPLSRWGAGHARAHRRSEEDLRLSAPIFAYLRPGRPFPTAIGCRSELASSPRLSKCSTALPA